MKQKKKTLWPNKVFFDDNCHPEELPTARKAARQSRKKSDLIDGLVKSVPPQPISAPQSLAGIEINSKTSRKVQFTALKASSAVRGAGKLLGNN